MYDKDYLCPTLTDMQGGGRQPHIVEVQKLNDVNFVYGRDADVERLCNAVKDEEQHLCKLNKMPQGELSSLDDAEICDIDAPTASTVTARYYKGIGAHKDNMVMKSIKIRQATKEGFIDCEVGGGGGFGLPIIRNTQGKSDREWSDMSNADNGEYP